MVEDAAELALAIRQVTLAVQRYRLRAARAGLGVGASEMMALSQLFIAGPCSPTELAAFLSMTTASVTSLLDRLQRAGHVVRRQHPSDRRKVVVELTPRARDTLTAMFAFAGAATAHAARSLSPSELGMVLRFLHNVTDAYDRTDPVAGLPENFGAPGDTSTGQPDEAISTPSPRPL
jgi:DNA-binding MarR family transcriptional regulator